MESIVRLTDGIFLDSQKIGEKMIDKLSCERLLAPFYEAVGKNPPAPRYGGWEAKGISGHTLGHYLTAMAKRFAATGSEDARKVAEYAADVLACLQKENGYICGFSEEQGFSGVFENKESFTSAGFDLAGWWVPYYTLHKVLRGLLDCYTLVGYENALKVAERLGLWVYNTTGTLNSEQRKRLLKCEYGGMNEALSVLYRITKDKRFKTASLFFCEEDILLPLSRGEDILTGLHANTQIPKIIGAVEIYNNGGEKYLVDAARFFFDTVTKNRSYCIGGHSVGEHFHKLSEEPLETNTCETCNSNNMLTLAKKLFALEHNGKYYDYCERVIFNHILGSQDENGMKTYFVGLKPGNFKVYSTPEESFWCCFGSGLENPFSYNEHIYYYEGGLYINLFIPSTFKNENVAVSLNTDFPNAGNAVITFCGDAENENILIRKPDWCREFYAEYNGEKFCETENGYVKISGSFKKGDNITVNLPCEFSVYRKRDDKNTVAYFYGPIVLCEPLGRENFPASDYAAGENDLTNYEGIETVPLQKMEMPVKIGDELRFSLPDNGIELKPFYAVHHERYRVYFNLSSV